MTINYRLEPGNATRYELLYTEYEDYRTGETKCCITWLINSGNGGPSFSWPKGEAVSLSYGADRMGIRYGCFVEIMKDIKTRFPGALT